MSKPVEYWDGFCSFAEPISINTFVNYNLRFLQFKNHCEIEYNFWNYSMDCLFQYTLSN